MERAPVSEKVFLPERILSAKREIIAFFETACRFDGGELALHTLTVHQNLRFDGQPVFPRDIVNPFVQLVKGYGVKAVEDNEDTFTATQKDVEARNILPVPLDFQPSVVGRGFVESQGQKLSFRCLF